MTAMGGEDETQVHISEKTFVSDETLNVPIEFVLSPDTPFDKTKGPEDPAQFHLMLPNEVRPDGTTESQKAIFMGFKIYPETSSTKGPTMCLKVGATTSEGKFEKKAIPLHDTDKRCKGLNDQKLRFSFNGSNDQGETEAGWMFAGVTGDLKDPEHTIVTLAKAIPESGSQGKQSEKVKMKTYSLPNFRNRNPKVEVQLPTS